MLSLSLAHPYLLISNVHRCDFGVLLQSKSKKKCIGAVPHFDAEAGGCLGKCCSLPTSVRGAGHPVEMLRASEVPWTLHWRATNCKSAGALPLPARLFPTGDPPLVWKLGQDTGVSQFSWHLLADQGMHPSSFNSWVMFSCFFFFSQSKESENLLAVCQRNTVAQVTSKDMSGFYILPYYITIFDCSPL